MADKNTTTPSFDEQGRFRLTRAVVENQSGQTTLQMVRDGVLLSGDTDTRRLAELLAAAVGASSGPVPPGAQSLFRVLLDREKVAMDREKAVMSDRAICLGTPGDLITTENCAETDQLRWRLVNRVPSSPGIAEQVFVDGVMSAFEGWTTKSIVSALVRREINLMASSRLEAEAAARGRYDEIASAENDITALQSQVRSMADRETELRARLGTAEDRADKLSAGLAASSDRVEQLESQVDGYVEQEDLNRSDEPDEEAASLRRSIEAGLVREEELRDKIMECGRAEAGLWTKIAACCETEAALRAEIAACCETESALRAEIAAGGTRESDLRSMVERNQAVITSLITAADELRGTTRETVAAQRAEAEDLRRQLGKARDETVSIAKDLAHKMLTLARRDEEVDVLNRNLSAAHARTADLLGRQAPSPPAPSPPTPDPAEGPSPVSLELYSPRWYQAAELHRALMSSAQHIDAGPFAAAESEYFCAGLAAGLVPGTPAGIPDKRLFWLVYLARILTPSTQPTRTLATSWTSIFRQDRPGDDTVSIAVRDGLLTSSGGPGGRDLLLTRRGDYWLEEHLWAGVPGQTAPGDNSRSSTEAGPEAGASSTEAGV